MKPLPFVVAALACALPVAAWCAEGAARRPLEPADLHRIADLSAPAASRDGKWIAYAVSVADVPANRYVSTIWLRSWDGATTREIRAGAHQSATQPAFLADSSAVTFLNDAGDEHPAQVWIAPLDGSAPHPVTELAGGVQDYALAPDGEHLVAAADVPGPEDGDDKAPIIIDRLLFKDDERGYLNGRRRHLFVVSLKDHHATQVTHGDFDAFLPTWSPDGAHIAYVSRHDEERGRMLGFDLYCIDAATGANERRVSHPDVINNDPDHLSRPAWSPDGRKLAYLQGGAEKWLEYAPWELVIADIATGSVRRVGTPDRGYTHPAFSADGSAVYALVEESRATYVSRIDLASGREQRLTQGPRFDFDLALGPDDRVALISGDDLHPYRLSVVDARGETVLPGHNDWLDQVEVQPLVETEFRSPDGTRVQGFLMKPAGYVAGRRYPTIVSLHGGPQYQFSHEFMFNWQLFAARGYAVVGVNVRGSSGRGFDYSRAIFADWGNVDVQDVLAGTDDAIARGVADPHRLGVGGWSYGGYLTNFVIARTHRFRAAVSGAGSGNTLAMYGTDEYTSWLELELGKPWKNRAAFDRVSFPFLHSDRITTPTLYLCGQIDFNVPCIGSEQMYQALRSNHVPSRLVIYPNMHHGPDTPGFALDRYMRYVEWFDRYLKDPVPSVANSGLR